MTTNDQLAKMIVEKLDKRKVFRKDIPKHLDRDKFLFLVEKDVWEVLDEQLTKQ